MQETKLTNDMKLEDFLDKSPVNFLAVNTIKKELLGAGFREIKASDSLGELRAGDKLFITKNDSSLYAFNLGTKTLGDVGFKMICAHCDSPTFRIKPNAEMKCEGGLVKLNTELYGGAVMSTWMDRPLSLAGRVILRGENALNPVTRLMHIKRALLTIPNLAIHFNRQVNDGVKLSKQKDMLPVLGFGMSESRSGSYIKDVICHELGCDAEEILDYDLYLYDTTPAGRVGLNGEFVQSGRLDDLSMVHAGLEALTNSEAAEMTNVLAIFDNEETGSATKQGAGSPFLASILERMVLAQGGNREDFYRAIEKAFMISADNAHAWHPNYPEKMDPTNHPVMGGGPVIKYNASQKYVSDAASAAVFMEICAKAGVPCQTFVNHSDVAGGSTLGNILSGSLPLRGVDMGNPIWAMHSARETGSIQDHEYCIKAFTEFYRFSL